MGAAASSIRGRDASPLADEELPMIDLAGLCSAGAGGSAETGPTSLRIRAEHGGQNSIVDNTSEQAKAKPKKDAASLELMPTTIAGEDRDLDLRTRMLSDVICRIHLQTRIT
jgi:hypothetical protein